MPANLCIRISSSKTTDQEEITFFEAAEWTFETEKQLLARLQDIFSVTRHIGVSLEMKLNIEVTDLRDAVFVIKKKTATANVINHQRLSVREIEVLGLVMQGLTNHEIAEKLFISYETVKSHRKNILEKTGAKNTAALITFYHQTFFEK